MKNVEELGSILPPPLGEVGRRTGGSERVTQWENPLTSALRAALRAVALRNAPAGAESRLAPCQLSHRESQGGFAAYLIRFASLSTFPRGEGFEKDLRWEGICGNIYL